VCRERSLERQRLPRRLVAKDDSAARRPACLGKVTDFDPFDIRDEPSRCCCEER